MNFFKEADPPKGDEHMREKLEKELEKIGLSEKEAKVYLAALELGPSTAQTIAAKATVNRPTTYIMIETLIKRGLMSSFEKGKKRFFIASKPGQLLYVLENKKKIIGEQEAELKKILPLFQEFVGKKASDFAIQVYEGSEVIKIIHQELLNNNDEVLELVPVDVVREFLPPVFPGDIRENFSKKFKIKSLYSSSTGKQKKGRPNVEYRFLNPDQFPFAAELLIFTDKIIITSFGVKPVSLHVQSPEITRTMRILFNALWEKAEK